MSPAVSKETMASQGSCTGGAWKSWPLRRDGVLIRQPGTTSGLLWKGQFRPLRIRCSKRAQGERPKCEKARRNLVKGHRLYHPAQPVSAGSGDLMAGVPQIAVDFAALPESAALAG